MWRIFQRKGRTNIPGNFSATDIEYSTGLPNRNESKEVKGESSFLSPETKTCYQGKKNLFTEKELLFIKYTRIWYQTRGFIILLFGVLR